MNSSDDEIIGQNSSGARFDAISLEPIVIKARPEKVPVRRHKKAKDVQDVGCQTEINESRHIDMIQQMINESIFSFFESNPQVLSVRDSNISAIFDETICQWNSKPNHKVNESPDSGVSSMSRSTIVPGKVVGRALNFPSKEPQNLSSRPPCGLLADLKVKFCEEFAAGGKCECAGCRQNFKSLDMIAVQKELQALGVLEIREIFLYCSGFRFLLKRFLPVLVEPMGSRKLVGELTSAIAVCPPELYETILFGFIHADMTLRHAVQTILDYRSDKSAEANRCVFTVITKYGLTLFFYDFFEQCMTDAEFIVDLTNVKQIIVDVVYGKRTEWTQMIRKIVYQHLKVDDQLALSADPVWKDFTEFECV